MIRLFHVYFPSRTLFLVVSEAMLVSGALLVSIRFRSGHDFELAVIYEQGLLKVSIASIVLMLCMYYYGLYDSRILHRQSEVFARLVQVLGTGSIILACLYYVYPQVELGRGLFLVWIALAWLALLAWRRLFEALNRYRGFADRTVLLGAGPILDSLSTEIASRPELGLRLLGYVESPSANQSFSNSLQYLGPIE